MTTKATMALAELSEKGADVDLLREMNRQITQRMMDMDVESLVRRRTRNATRSALTAEMVTASAPGIPGPGQSI